MNIPTQLMACGPRTGRPHFENLNNLHRVGGPDGWRVEVIDPAYPAWCDVTWTFDFGTPYEGEAEYSPTEGWRLKWNGTWTLYTKRPHYQRSADGAEYCIPNCRP